MIRIALISLILVLSLMGCKGKKDAGGKPYNVLWLIIEDLSPDLGCYGNLDVSTPNIDSLASLGTLYNHAYTTAPVCSPSRSAFMTGMYQTTIGAHHHRSHKSDGYTLPDTVKTAPEYFRQNGYYTSNVKHGFDGFKGTGKIDLNFKAKKLFDGNHWDSLKSKQPFYAQVNFAPVHRMLYKMPDTLTVDPDSVHLPPYYPDHPIARLDWAKYLTKVMLLDNMVGEVIQKLKSESLLENTIIVLFGDNGRNHVRGKQWLYDPGIHIPLIIVSPDQNQESVSNEFVSGIDLLPASLYMAGLPPSTSFQGQNFLDQNIPKREYIVAARDRCDESEERVRAIRDKEFKYIRNYRPELAYMQPNKYKEAYYPMWTMLQELDKRDLLNEHQSQFVADVKPKEELYDLINDPDEIKNLAGNPKYDSKMVEMRGLLDDWIDETQDQGQFTEPATALTKWKEKIDQWDVSRLIEEQRNLMSKYD